MKWAGRRRGGRKGPTGRREGKHRQWIPARPFSASNAASSASVLAPSSATFRRAASMASFLAASASALAVASAWALSSASFLALSWASASSSGPGGLFGRLPPPHP